MKRTILGGLAAAGLLLGALGVAGGPAQATPSDKVQICHATSSSSNPYTSNNVNSSSIDEVNNKYLNGHGDHSGDIIPPFSSPDGSTFPGKNWTGENQAIWANGCNVPPVPTLPPPPPPPPPEWTPPQYPLFNPPPECATYQIEKMTSTWDGDTGTWSGWTDWSADAVDPDDRPLTGHHNTSPHGEDGDRHFAYVVVNVDDSKCTPVDEKVIAVDPEVTPPTCDAPGFVTLPQETEGYKWIKQEDGTYLAVAAEGFVLEGDTIFNPGDLIQLEGEDCETSTKPPTKTFTKWTGEFECGDTRVVETRVRTTTTYVWDEKAEEFIVGDVKTKTQTRTRNLKDDEQYPCPTLPPVIPPVIDPPVIDPPVAELPVADPPPAVAGDSGTVPDTVAVTTTTVPPVVTTVPPVVAGDSGTELPATGPSQTTGMALMALGFLLTGLGVLAMARRPEDEPLI